MADNGDTNWESILGGAAQGALSEWLDTPNDQSVSASDAAATQGGNSLPERNTIPVSSGDANTGNTGWALPQGNSMLLFGGAALAAILAAVVLAD